MLKEGRSHTWHREDFQRGCAPNTRDYSMDVHCARNGNDEANHSSKDGRQSEDLTRSLAEIKLFNEWCQARQVTQMSTPEQWSLIAQCFPQDTLDVMETIVGGKRSGEDLPQTELRQLTLDEALRCLKASAPNVGSNYIKADTIAGNLLRRTKTRNPLTREAAIEMTKQIRVIMSVCPDAETISKNMDSVRSEFRAWASSMRAPPEMDDGGAFNLRTHSFIKNGKHERQIEDFREGERLLQ